MQLAMDLNKSVIVFHSPSSDNDKMFINSFDDVTIDSLSLTNLTFYDPDSSTPIFAEFGTYISKLTLKNLILDTINAPINDAAIFVISTKGLEVTNVTATNLETISYGYSQTDYSYVCKAGPLFQFNPFSAIAGLGDVMYSLVSFIDFTLKLRIIPFIVSFLERLLLS